MIIIGGLGGGGDVGLSAILVEEFNLHRKVSAIVSFARCNIRHGKEFIKPALLRIYPGVSLGKRVFEDKLLRIVWWVKEAFIVCVNNPWNELVNALDYVYGYYKPKYMVHTDLGGDALMLGYEEELGSYKVDTVARALLYYTSMKYGVNTILAIGGIGAEGGGNEIKTLDIAAVLYYLDQHKAILGTYIPSRESLSIAKKLLNMAKSGMLPLFIQAVEGKKVAEIHMAYLSGSYEIKPWYRYIVFVNTSKLCSLSPLCMKALNRGMEGIKEWKKPRPPQDLEHIYKRLKRILRREGEEAINSIIMKILSKYFNRFDLRKYIQN